MSKMYRLWRQNSRFRPIVTLAQQLHRLRLVLPAAKQGPGLSLLRSGLSALGPEGNDAVWSVQKVNIYLDQFNLRFPSTHSTV